MPKEFKNISFLITESLKGNRIAEKQLYNCYAPKVLTICRRYAPDESLAHDFFQECWITIFNKLKKYDASKGVFEGWLYRVCVNKCLTELRKNKTRESIVLSSIESTITEAAQIVESNTLFSEEEILDAIQKLPAGYREVFNLYVIDGWKHEEIAHKLNIKPDTSRSQLSRAKVKMKSFLNSLIKKGYEKGLV